jgi:excisionase family DNA binding protein
MGKLRYSGKAPESNGVNMSKYLSVSEVAADLGISSQTVYMWFRSGKFVEMYKFGGTYRIEESIYQEWKNKQINGLTLERNN